ncbi:hypothetical protein ACFV9D_25915 [Streptomyces sp. NPDC059875]
MSSCRAGRSCQNALLGDFVRESLQPADLETVDGLRAAYEDPVQSNT